MPKFTITVRSLATSDYEIEAKDATEAATLARQWLENTESLSSPMEDEVAPFGERDTPFVYIGTSSDSEEVIHVS